jgi:hypothetical protein
MTLGKRIRKARERLTPVPAGGFCLSAKLAHTMPSRRYRIARLNPSRRSKPSADLISRVNRAATLALILWRHSLSPPLAGLVGDRPAGRVGHRQLAVVNDVEPRAAISGSPLISTPKSPSRFGSHESVVIAGKERTMSKATSYAARATDERVTLMQLITSNRSVAEWGTTGGCSASTSAGDYFVGAG